jgi:hypothetical protein
MSRSVVFNESVMFYDSLTSDRVPYNFDKHLQPISVQVEHVDDEEGVQVRQHVHDDTGVQVERLWMTRIMKLLIMRLMMMFNTYPLFCS